MNRAIIEFIDFTFKTLPITSIPEKTVVKITVIAIPDFESLTNLFKIIIATITIVIGYKILSTGTDILIIVLSPKFDIANPIRVNIFTYVLYLNLGNVSTKYSETTTIRPAVVVKQVSIVIAPKNTCPKLPKSSYELFDNI